MKKILEVTTVTRTEKHEGAKGKETVTYAVLVTLQGIEEGQRSCGTFFFPYSEAKNFWVGKQIMLDFEGGPQEQAM